MKDTRHPQTDKKLPLKKDRTVKQPKRNYDPYEEERRPILDEGDKYKQYV